jgi:hypothetical protein
MQQVHVAELLQIVKARHFRAEVEGLGIPDLAVGVLLGLGGVAAQFAELVETRPDGAERGFLGCDLVAVVAVAAYRQSRDCRSR